MFGKKTSPNEKTSTSTVTPTATYPTDRHTVVQVSTVSSILSRPVVASPSAFISPNSFKVTDILTPSATGLQSGYQSSFALASGTSRDLSSVGSRDLASSQLRGSASGLLPQIQNTAFCESPGYFFGFGKATDAFANNLVDVDNLVAGELSDDNEMKVLTELVY